MKRILVIPAVIVLGLTACDTMNRPISSGDFDPLRPPGSNSTLSTATGPSFKAGQFVRATMDSTAFFKTRPKGDGDADKLLPRGTSMKVISTSDSYVKVELDSGEVGFVPAIMLEDPNAAANAPAANPNEFQVYPPLGGYGQPLPTVPTGEMPPEGAIPTVIDPEAPATTTPVPPVAPTTDTFPAPAVEPKTGPAPLPPNGEEEKEAEKKPAEETPKLEE
jgi:hypothetical protein